MHSPHSVEILEYLAQNFLDVRDAARFGLVELNGNLQYSGHFDCDVIEIEVFKFVNLITSSRSLFILVWLLFIYCT